MLDAMSNQDLIDFIFEDPDSSVAANEAAERLSYAIDEIDRLILTIRQLESANGTNP